MPSLRFFLLFSFLILTPNFGRSASAQKYTITDLGSLSDGTLGFESSISSMGTAINNKGWITGFAAAPHEYAITHAFLWVDGTMHDLGALAPQDRTQGKAINNHGQVIGSDVSFSPRNNEVREHTFLYSGGKMTDIGTLPNHPDAIEGAINDTGDVVGTAGDFSRGHDGSYKGSWHGFLYHKGTLSDLGTLPGATGSGANGINKRGQATGGSGGHIILYDKGKRVDLGCLPGYNTSGSAINDNGEIVGSASLFTPNPKSGQATLDVRVVLYRNHILMDLMMPHGKNAEVGSISINNHSQIVCTVYDGMPSLTGAAGRGCLYSSEKWTDLNDLVEPKSKWSVKEAKGINDLGQIVGSAIYYGPGKLNGVTHAVLLTPIK